MSVSVRSQAVTAALAALSAAGVPCAVYRSRTEQFTQEDVPAFNVWPVEEKYSDTKDDNSSLDVTLTLRVQCIVAQAETVDTAVEPLAVWAHQQLMADTSLGGIAANVLPVSAKWTIEPGNKDVCAYDLDFDISLGISRGDPTVNTFYQ